MAKRVELKENDLVNVAGGAWNYYDSDNNGTVDKCRIDGDKTYNCNAGSKNNIIVMMVKNPGLSLQEYISMALDKGYIW